MWWEPVQLERPTTTVQTEHIHSTARSSIWNTVVLVPAAPEQTETRAPQASHEESSFESQPVRDSNSWAIFITSVALDQLLPTSFPQALHLWNRDVYKTTICMGSLKFKLHDIHSTYSVLHGYYLERFSMKSYENIWSYLSAECTCRYLHSSINSASMLPMSFSPSSEGFRSHCSHLWNDAN